MASCAYVIIPILHEALERPRHLIDISTFLTLRAGTERPQLSIRWFSLCERTVHHIELLL